MAWTRKFLRVNLNRGSCVSEPLNMAWAAQFLGQWGLASKYLVSEIDPGADPLAPDNKLIYATGPLTGTMASTGGRYSVVTKGPLTGAVACSNSGGYFGAELKFAGWDMIIIEGRSPQPVYLHIENERAELLPAGDLWGRTVWDTEAMLRKRHQDSLLRVSSIGRAGENLVLFAAIVNDLHRAAGRSGVGAVMGSKNLKAVAVRGTRGLGNIADPQAFMAAVTAGKRVLAENAVTGQGLPTYGTQVLMNVINEMGASPTRNHRDVQFEGARRISAEAMHEQRATDGRTHLVTNQACCGCTIACGRISRIDESHFSVANKPQYWGASGGLEYEAAWALGNANGVDDLEALQYANLLCNEDGMDPISFGATVGAVMELYELGVLSKDEIGIDAPFGSAAALCRFAEMTARDGRQARASEGLSGRHGSGRLEWSVRVHHLRMDDERHPAAGPGRLRWRLVAGSAAADRRAHLEPRARVQPGGRHHRQGRHAAAAAAQRTLQDRCFARHGGGTRQDAAGVLQPARLDHRRRSDGRHPRAAGSLRCRGM